jgi:hypothetical protein
MQKQGMRERNYEPSNPQTNPQASQRLKMLAAQRVYGALKPIVSRAWQGVKYGAMSRQQYLKYALSMTDGYPYVSKEDSRTIPGKYQISKGTLHTISASALSIADINTGLTITSEIGQATTIGQLSQQILDNQPYIQLGDQLTFVICLMDGIDADEEVILGSNYTWVYYSFFVDPTDTRLPSDVFTEVRLSKGTQGNSLRIGPDDYHSTVAAATILSRLDSDTGQYLRSTETLDVVQEVLAIWSKTEQVLKARRSYQPRLRTRAADWEVEDQEDASRTIQTLYTISGVTGQYAPANGRQCYVRVYEDTGDLAAVYVAGDEAEAPLVSQNGTSLSITISGEEAYVYPENIPALASLPQVIWTA